MNELAISTLSHDEARSLTDEVKNDAERLWRKLVELYEGGAHLALGYAAWGSYFEAEFGQSKSHGYRMLEAARVASILPHSPKGERPTERQARELAPLLGDADQLRDAWQEANTNGNATAATVREAVARRLPGPREAQRIAIEENRVVVGTDGYYTPTSHIDADTRWQIITEWAKAIDRELPADPADIPIPEYATGLEESAERVREYVTRFLLSRRHEEAA